MRVDVKPALLQWACERARLSANEAHARFPALAAWQSGAKQPTMKQLEKFAKATHAPVGYLFLAAPPVENVPIPDFRTMNRKEVRRPSADLLDSIYLCQQRQEWFRDYMIETREDPRTFVGSVTAAADVVTTATTMRQALGFNLQARHTMPTWSDALRSFIGQADALGVLVMVNGVVGSNTHRKLDPEEFRGFALADVYAPLVFINGADTKAAQMFTLAHELAHIWLGASAISDAGLDSETSQAVEVWCNQVAAELLVPMAAFRAEFNAAALLANELQRLARMYKVSTLVILRRALDANALTRAQFSQAYAIELARLKTMRTSSGGDFYTTLPVRVGHRFARAVLVSALEGQTLHRDAFRMLGFSNATTFYELARRLKVA